ncbi:MAG: hypothetical protein II477_04165 [Lachnospiraceae bacterium]|nr:hypothetical protein [Lachnospiraceae bacterium]
MKNIMKSIWYEILRRKTLIVLFFVFIAVMAISGFSATADATLGFERGGVSDMLAAHPWMPYEFPLLFLTIFVGYVCCEDYKDKVANYEILFGHSRKSIYFARSLMAIMIGTILTMLLSFLPLLVGNALAGWGDTLEFSDILLRYLLLGLPYLRLAAFLAMIAFLVKSPYLMIAVGIVISMMIGGLGDMVRHSSSVFLSLFNMIALTEYDGWCNYNIDPTIGTIRYYAYDSSIPAGLVSGTIIASLLMTAFYLFMGYALFRRDELN